MIKKSKKPSTSLLIVIIALLLAILSLIVWNSRRSKTEPISQSPPKTSDNSLDQKQADEPNDQPEVLDKNMHSIDEPGSIWWIVNKNRPLPDNYQPSSLKSPSVSLRLGSGVPEMTVREDIIASIENLFQAGKNDGNNFVFASGFRSQSTQRELYNMYVSMDGQEAADRYSARPGTSEHQTGLTFDICTPDDCSLEEYFGQTAAGIWIKENAHNYGFIVRYPESKEPITGYSYEPWHLRYVGIELATELKNKNLTMEEYFLL